MNKEKLLMILDEKIKQVKKEYEYDNNLSNDNPNKNMFVHVSGRALRELEEIKALIESGLVD